MLGLITKLMLSGRQVAKYQWDGNAYPQGFPFSCLRNTSRTSLVLSYKHKNLKKNSVQNYINLNWPWEMGPFIFGNTVLYKASQSRTTYRLQVYQAWGIFENNFHAFVTNGSIFAVIPSKPNWAKSYHVTTTWGPITGRDDLRSFPDGICIYSCHFCIFLFPSFV